MKDNLFNLFPGEHIFSALSRWHLLNVSYSFDASMKGFGLNKTFLSPLRAFDPNTKHLYRLAIGKSAYQCWSQHYLGNYYWPFLSLKEQKIVINELETSSEHTLKLREGNASNHKFWRWCGQCAEEDESKYGVAYFHQNHQVHGVFHCYRHGSGLIGECKHCGFYIKNIHLNNFMTSIGKSCPNCDKKLQGYDGYFSEFMKNIESVCLSLSANKRDFSVEKVVGLQTAFANLPDFGLQIKAPNKLKEKWYQEVSHDFDAKAISAYFSKVIIKDGLSNFPQMRSPRIWGVGLNTKPLAPLNHLIMLHYTGVNITTLIDQPMVLE